MPVHTSQESGPIDTAQFIGSIGACARNGNSYSASTVVFAVWSAVFTSPAAAAFMPSFVASARYSSRSFVVSSPAPVPGSQSTSSASRPSLAAQKWSATTATPEGTCTTARTPGTAFALSARNALTLPPKTGDRAIRAVFIPGICTSIANCAWPVTFCGESRRLVALPRIFQSLRSFSATEAGGFCAWAALASDPKEALCAPETTKPFSARQEAGETFHCAAAAATSISRAMAPTWR